MISPEDEINRYKEKIEPILKSFFDKKSKEYESLSPFITQFVEHLGEFTLRGGKRFRAALIYYSYKLFGGKDDEEITKLSIFIELVQSFLLIHDDIMDRSALRRGGTTIHKIYEAFSKEHHFQDDVHLGNTMGILSGDLANQFALEIIGDSNFPLENKNELIKLVASEISKVCFGQIHDILLNYNYPKDYKEEDIIRVHYYKTATYTYRLPLFAGAVLAGANSDELKSLDEYAMPSGIAFQIRDDVLGVFGESEETGKENKGDLTEGKKTLLVTEAYRNANQQQKDKIDQYLGKKDLTDLEAEEIRVIFKETNALEYSKKQCEKHVEKAKEALLTLKGRDGHSYEFLKEIAHYMIIRNV